MGMKFAKQLVDEFTTRSFQEDDLTFFEVSRNGKPLMTMAQSNPNTLWVWNGSAKNRAGKLKSQRTTEWSQFGLNFKVEGERKLYRLVAEAFREQAESMF